MLNICYLCEWLFSFFYVSHMMIIYCLYHAKHEIKLTYENMHVLIAMYFPYHALYKICSIGMSILCLCLCFLDVVRRQRVIWTMPSWIHNSCYKLIIIVDLLTWAWNYHKKICFLVITNEFDDIMIQTVVKRKRGVHERLEVIKVVGDSDSLAWKVNGNPYSIYLISILFLIQSQEDDMKWVLKLWDTLRVMLCCS